MRADGGTLRRQLLICVSYAIALLAFAGVRCDAAKDIAWMTTEQLIKNMNYTVEKHEVICSDGYILNHFRIPHGKNGPGSKSGVPVLIQHGLVGNSDPFVATNTKQVNSIGFLLADAGFDVWLINDRGTIYSRGHTKKSFIDPTYFDYSYHDMGTVDLPESIDYILKVTGKKKVAHIGHSQGNTAMWVMLSTKPEYNDKIIASIAHAPVAYHYHSRSPIFRSLQPFDKIGLLKTLPARSVELPRNKLITWFLTTACDSWTPTKYICEWAYFFIMGYNPEELDPKEIRNIYARYPGPSSLKQFTHFVQGTHKPVFQQFDYIKMVNLKKYGSFSPPSYNLSNVRAEVYSFYGDRDKFCQVKDVKLLHSQLRNLKEEFYIEKWSHYDFLFGINVREKIYEPTIEILKKVTQ